MSTRSKLFLAFLLFCGFAVNAYAGDAAVTFSRLSMPVTPGSVGVAFFRVKSPVDDTILSAHSDCCDAVELHTHSMANGIMRMRRVDSVPLKANVATVFQPGGLHVMLIGLKKPMEAGDQIPLTFTFEHAPEQTVTFTATPAKAAE